MRPWHRGQGTTSAPTRSSRAPGRPTPVRGTPFPADDSAAWGVVAALDRQVRDAETLHALAPTTARARGAGEEQGAERPGASEAGAPQAGPRVPATAPSAGRDRTGRPADGAGGAAATGTPQRETFSEAVSSPSSRRVGSPSQSPGTVQANAPVADAVRSRSTSGSPARSSAR